MERFKTSRILEEKHATQIILFLHACGPQSKSDIYRTISTNSRMPQKLEILCREGVLEERRAGTGNAKTLFSLTSLGREFAVALCELEEKSGGSLAPLRKEMYRCVIDERAPSDRRW